MEKLLVELQEHSETVETLVEKIEAGEAYMEELKAYLPILNQMIIKLFELFQTSMYSIELSQEFVLQVLNDIIYGIEKEDTVCLTDVLRYGLIEIFNYVAVELQGEE